MARTPPRLLAKVRANVTQGSVSEMALTTEEKMSWLARVELFEGCSPAALRQVAERSGEIAFPAGRHIVTQGLIGNGLYVIVAGRARVVKGDESVALLGPGDFFGELSVIDQLPRTATVVADEETICLALASWDLIAEIERDPQLALNLLRGLARRLRAVGEQHRH
jgi:CRP/FNR family cyclic AMP-dependent transcriptional regulator